MLIRSFGFALLSLGAACSSNASDPSPAPAGSSSHSVQACSAPAGYVVERDATVAPDSMRVVVMLPAGAVATGYRVFYGAPDRMVERTVTSTSFGSVTRIFAFDVDGIAHTAVFSSGPNPPPTSAPRLIVGDEAGQHETHELTVIVQNGPPSTALSFYCR